MLEKHTRAGIVEHLADERNGICLANLMLRVQAVGLRQAREWDFLARNEPCRREHGRKPAFRHIGPALFVEGIVVQDGQRHPIGKSGYKHMAFK